MEVGITCMGNLLDYEAASARSNRSNHKKTLNLSLRAVASFYVASVANRTQRNGRALSPSPR